MWENAATSIRFHYTLRPDPSLDPAQNQHDAPADGPAQLSPAPPQRRKRPRNLLRLRGPWVSAGYAERPARARRPILPQPCAAVLSAMAVLTSGFGMGPGDPRLQGRARAGRLGSARLLCRRARSPRHPGGCTAFGRDGPRIGSNSWRRRARAISTARLRRSLALHLRPIDQVFCLGPYRKEDSSWRRLPT